MDIAFDPVTEADGPTLLQLACAFHVEDGHPLDIDGEAAIELIVKGDPAARAWIVRDAGEAVGYVIITLGFSVEYGGRDGFIDDLYLCPQIRGQGIGRRLLDFTLSQAARLGIRMLHLEVESENTQAHGLYQAAGFEETGRRLMRCHLRP